VPPSAASGPLPRYPAAQAPDVEPPLARAAWHEVQRSRQEDGLEALLDMSVHVSFASAEAPTVLIPLPLSPEPAETTSPSGPVAALLARLRRDHLVRSSLYLLLNAGVQAVMAFTFWIIVARLFPPTEVGQASSLVSATSLISYFALFGLNTTLIRFLPTASNKNSLVTGAIMLVAICAGVIGLGYVLLTPVFAPRISYISHRLDLTLGFVLLNAAVAVNLITDSVFVSSRKASLCTLTDGGIGGLGRIAFAFVLTGSGAYGLFSASALGFALAAVASVILIVTSVGLRPSFKDLFSTLRPLLRFSGANYVANVLNLLPNVVVPIIVLDRIGPADAAYYFVAFQIATLLYSAVQTVEGAFLAEGSQEDADWRQIRRRSRILAAVLFVPGCLVLLLSAHWLLLAFGPRYSQHGTGILQVFAITVIPIAFCNWSWTVLRLTGRLRALVASNAVFAVGICGTAWVLASHGLTPIAIAWPVGCTAAAVVAGMAVVLRPRAPARHRRPTGSRRAPA
jgi:O-antigen/teichoic acid export membrane protein